MDVFTDPTNLDVYLTAFLWILRLTAACPRSSRWCSASCSRRCGSPRCRCCAAFGTAWVNIFRNTPLTLIIFFCYFGLFATLGLELCRTTSTSTTSGSASSACRSTPPRSSARRSAPASTPCRPGQAEAARAIGLTFIQTLRIIVLPQAGRAVIAPLGSIFIALTKNATIVGTIGLAEASNVDEGNSSTTTATGHRDLPGLRRHVRGRS